MKKPQINDTYVGLGILVYKFYEIKNNKLIIIPLTTILSLAEFIVRNPKALIFYSYEKEIFNVLNPSLKDFPSKVTDINDLSTKDPIIKKINEGSFITWVSRGIFYPDKNEDGLIEYTSNYLIYSRKNLDLMLDFSIRILLYSKAFILEESPRRMKIKTINLEYLRSLFLQKNPLTLFRTPIDQKRLFVDVVIDLN